MANVAWLVVALGAGMLVASGVWVIGLWSEEMWAIFLGAVLVLAGVGAFHVALSEVRRGEPFEISAEQADEEISRAFRSADFEGLRERETLEPTDLERVRAAQRKGRRQIEISPVEDPTVDDARLRLGLPPWRGGRLLRDVEESSTAEFELEEDRGES